MEEKKLTVKQRRFVKEYIKTGNGTQSAIKAGYSKKTAGVISDENLKKPYIKAKIEKTMSEEAESIGMTAKFILEKIKRINDLDVIENQKIASTILKSLEVSARHLGLLKEEKVIDMRLSEHKALIEDLSKYD